MCDEGSADSAELDSAVRGGAWEVPGGAAVTEPAGAGERGPAGAGTCELAGSAEVGPEARLAGNAETATQPEPAGGAEEASALEPADSIEAADVPAGAGTCELAGSAEVEPEARLAGNAETATQPEPAGCDSRGADPAASESGSHRDSRYAGPPKISHGKAGAICAICAVALFALDRATKAWAIANLDEGITEFIPGFMSFVLVFNEGASFGSMQGATTFLLAISAVICALIVAYMVAWKRHAVYESVAVGAVLAGAIGNALDRALYGEVTDFLNFEFISFPVFNVADCCITIGIVVMLIFLFFDADSPIVESDPEGPSDGGQAAAGATGGADSPAAITAADMRPDLEVAQAQIAVALAGEASPSASTEAPAEETASPSFATASDMRPDLEVAQAQIAVALAGTAGAPASDSFNSASDASATVAAASDDAAPASDEAPAAVQAPGSASSEPGAIPQDMPPAGAEPAGAPSQEWLQTEREGGSDAGEA